jgi:hypothetical protein
MDGIQNNHHLQSRALCRYCSHRARACRTTTDTMLQYWPVAPGAVCARVLSSAPPCSRSWRGRPATPSRLCRTPPAVSCPCPPAPLPTRTRAQQVPQSPLHPAPGISWGPARTAQLSQRGLYLKGVGGYNDLLSDNVNTETRTAMNASIKLFVKSNLHLATLWRCIYHFDQLLLITTLVVDWDGSFTVNLKGFVD